MPKLDPEFWRHKRLDELNKDEWEALCDRCGKCCLIKLEYEDSDEIAFTDVVCRLSDCETGNCRDYPNRVKHVPDCVQLSPENLNAVNFMPPSCAYRLLNEGKELRSWHPLISGTQETVHLAGMSIRNRVISEDEIDDEQDYIDRIVKWPKRK